MKKFLLIILIIPLICFSKPRKIVCPAPLKTGDKVFLLSPSSCPKTEYVEKAEEMLINWGYSPIRGEHVLSNDHSYAGTPKERLSDIMQALTNPEIKAILCTRGGQGSYQELQMLPLDTLRKYPKWLIGYSDVTAVHSALQSAGIMSIHGPMGCDMKDAKDSLDIINLHEILQGHLPSYSFSGHELNKDGIVSGVLIGGNLSLLEAMSNSDWDCFQYYNECDSLILFIEDVSESIESVNRMLHHLQMCGNLAKVKGIIVGAFTKYQADIWPSMEEMIADFLADYNIPIAYGFPAGHIKVNYPLILGGRVLLKVSKESVQLDFLAN